MNTKKFITAISIPLLVVIALAGWWGFHNVTLQRGNAMASTPAVATNKLEASKPSISISATKKSYVLESNFLKSDATAKSILQGTAYDLVSHVDPRGTVSADSFVFKFMNGLRQLGYTGISSLLPTSEQAPLVWLHKFQRVNSLPVTSTITAEELVMLDKLLVARERKDAQVASALPNSITILPGSSAEPSTSHVAALLTVTLQSLPKKISSWNSQNILGFINVQGPGGDGGGIQNTSRGLCFLSYYNTLDIANDCTSTNTTIFPGLMKDDPSLAYNILHEYAHYLDGRVYTRGPSETNQGMIDTEGFAAISYDTSVNCNPTSSWRFFQLKNPTNEFNEFVTDYARGYSDFGSQTCKGSLEDFADSFAMYVMQGDTFRKLAITKPVIGQKYAWLKKNVFSGKEYSTGDPNNIPAINEALEEPYAPLLPMFIDYLTINKTFVWNYKL